ncbi:MAG TPA: hypothetical protein PK737_00290 [Bacilli bacterium]|nr:hypothetical protein [Bacilli bacterium]
MMSKKLDQLHQQIVGDCINLIKEKEVDVSELAYRIGISMQQLLFAFRQRVKDFSIYLRAYDLLIDWQE